MNETEKFLFDINGYIVVRNALTPQQVHDLKEKLNMRLSAKSHYSWKNKNDVKDAPNDPVIKDRILHFGSDRAWPKKDELMCSSPSLLEWGGTYIELLDLPSIKPYLETLIGKNYRLDHDYANVFGDINGSRRGRLAIHGGGGGAGGPNDLVGPTDGGQCYYRYNNGTFYNGLVAVAFELNSLEPDDGGFACIAGSHKANFPVPKEFKPPNIFTNQDELPECVTKVAVNAGDAIIFTEALSHGTVPMKKGIHKERKTIFYKYCPHAVAWGPDFYNADNYPGLTDAQKKLLLPPSAFGPLTGNFWYTARKEQQELKKLREEVKMLKSNSRL